MPSVFDQFDSDTAVAQPANPFDSFDQPNNVFDKYDQQADLIKQQAAARSVKPATTLGELPSVLFTPSDETAERAAQEVATHTPENVDALGADVGPIIPPTTPQDISTLTGLNTAGRPAKALSAVATTPGAVANSFATPEGALVLANPAAGAAFVAQMATSVPKDLGAAAGAYSAGDQDAGDAALINGLVTAGMLALPTAHLLKNGAKLDDAIGKQNADQLRQSVINQNEALQKTGQAQPPAESEAAGGEPAAPLPPATTPAGAPPVTEIPEPTGGGVNPPLTGEQVGNQIGAKFDSEYPDQNGNLVRNFTFNREGDPHINNTIQIPADATPEEIAAKVAQVRKSYEADSTHTVQPDATVPGQFNIVNPSGKVLESFPSQAEADAVLPEYNKPGTPSEVDAIMSKSAKMKPSDFSPALMIDGKPVTGGNTHGEIYRNLPDDLRLGAGLDAFRDGQSHVFVDKTGKVYSRMEASKAMGVKFPMESNILNEMKAAEAKQSPGMGLPMEETKNAPAATGETRPPAQSHTGLGGAVPSEFERGQGSPTAMKYRLLDQERQKRGLPPLAKPDSVSDQATLDRATAEIDKNPSLPDQLVAELNKKPRPISDWERAVLLLHKIDLRDQYEKSAREASQAYEDSKEFPLRADDMRAANLRTAALSDQLNELEQASKKSGTEQGRGLRALQIMVNEDHTLAALETRLRASKGGAPLTDEERAGLQKTADDYKKANDALTKHLADTREANSKLQAQRALDEAYRQQNPPVEPHVKIIADRISKYFGDRADAALKRLSGKTFSYEAALPDLVDLGVSTILKGAADFTSWSAEMVGKTNASLTPHLKDLWEKTNKALDDHIRGEKGNDVTKQKVRKAVREQTSQERTASISKKIGERINAGEKDEITGLVQKLARQFVKDGVSDRDELIDRIHGILKEFDPSISRIDAMDAISGYGDFKPLSKDEVSVKLRGMKGEIQQVRKLIDMQRGIPPAKTGIERRTPTDKERALIKAVNDAKLKFQVPITDPLTQLKSALDTKKTQLENSIKDLQARIDAGDFARRTKTPLVLDRRAQELTAQKEAVAKKFKKLQNDYEKAQAKAVPKSLDFISNLRRFSVLSGVNVLGKLAAYSATKLPTIAGTEAVGGLLSKIPKLSEIAKRAPSEGGFSASALANATAKAFTKGITDAWRTLSKGQSELKEAFSNRPESGHEWYNFFQTIHEAIKSPLRRAAFELSLSKRMEFAARNGADVNDPIVQLALAKDAYVDSDRALLLENNRLSNGVRLLFRNLEAKNKATGQVPIGGKVGATVGRVEFPILSVPLNYVKQTLVAAFGLISGSIKARAAFKRGIENLDPREADEILRHLKYGTVGGALALYGFYDGYHNGANGTLGGFYQPGQKRKDDQAAFGGMRVAGHNVPSLLLHNPIIAVAQLTHTIGALMASKINKKTAATHGITASTIAGLFGLLNQSPLGSVVELASQLSDPRSADWALGEHVKGLLVPQLIQETANASDKDAKGNVIKRAPVTIPEHVETGIPGLRQTVKKK
jgi:hypothetical protein